MPPGMAPSEGAGGMSHADEPTSLFGHLKRAGAQRERARPQAEEAKAPKRSGAAAASSPFGRAMARALWWTGALAIAGGCGAAGFATGGVAGLVAGAAPIEAMDNYDPPEATTLTDRDGRQFAGFFVERRSVVPLREIPSRLAEAFVAIEDTAFPHHLGVNPKGIVRAAVINARNGSSRQGASTITQQLTRNLPLGIGREKTIERKIREAVAALQMERLYTKDQILEVYLNQIYLGSGAYGVQAAARTYFDKPLDALSPAEMAMLAGLPQLPEAYSPLNNPDRALDRRTMVLDRLFALAWIGDQEYLDAVDSELAVRTGGAASSAPAWAGAFADAVRAELARAADIDGAALRAEGLRISTTMDPALQEAAARVLAAGLEQEQEQWLALRPARFDEEIEEGRLHAKPRKGEVRMGRVVQTYPGSLVVELGDGWRADVKIPAATADLFGEPAGISPGAGVDVEVLGVETGGRRLWRGRLLPDTRLQGALVCLDRRTGEPRAIAGAHTWGDRANNGYYNRAILARRQAGSTLKPFFFAVALDNGLTPESRIVDQPIAFGDYRPRNYDEKFHGTVTLQKALEQSYNVCTLRMVHEMGLEPTLDRVREFDCTADGPHWELPPWLPTVLGSSGTTPMELAAAYRAFANLGVVSDPSTIRSVVNAQGRPVPLPQHPGADLLADRTAAWMTQMMMGVMTHGSGRHARELLPDSWKDCVAGKSGTTSDSRDAWFAGFTPDHVVVVFLGFDRPVPLGPGRSGGNSAGPIWGAFVAQIAALNGNEPPAEGLALPDGWTLALLDTQTGQFVSPEGRTAGGRYSWRAVQGDVTTIDEPGGGEGSYDGAVADASSFGPGFGAE